jgi:hypothetical protein
MSIFSRSVRKSEATAVKPVNLKLVKINFWSAVRFAFILTVALGIGLVVALTVIFLIMNLTGFSELLKSFAGAEVSLPGVLSIGLGIALFNILFGTLLAGVYAVIFNIVARITGGVSVGFTNN